MCGLVSWPPADLGELRQAYSPFATWLPHEEFLRMRDLGNSEESESCSEGPLRHRHKGAQ